jgi:alcohol dehydrogenase (NADP+)
MRDPETRWARLNGLRPTRPIRTFYTERDVQIEILFCGLCHSDVHTVPNEWSEVIPTTYPVVPGHEIVGRVSAVGSSVSRYKTGDLVGVGCLVDSDGTCEICDTGSRTANRRGYSNALAENMKVPF